MNTLAQLLSDEAPELCAGLVATCGTPSDPGFCWCKETARRLITRGVTIRDPASEAAIEAALRWLVGLGRNVGKAGGHPKQGEWEEAFDAAKLALAAASKAKTGSPTHV